MLTKGNMPRTASPTEESDHSRISEERVGELLDIAADIFFEHGFEASSVGEMARRAKASKATFYSRYATKELLFDAVVRRKTDLGIGPIQSVFQKASSPEDVLTAFATELLNVSLRPDAIALVRVLYMESQRFPELGRIFYRHGIDRALGLLTDYLREQNRASTLRVHDVRLASEFFADSVLGEPTRRAVLAAGDVPGPRERAARVKEAVRTFLSAHRVSDR
jgi:TetR/AcrR family transcriptional regulator, mexJK operon transcriptional repressor